MKKPAKTYTLVLTEEELLFVKAAVDSRCTILWDVDPWSKAIERKLDAGESVAEKVEEERTRHRHVWKLCRRGTLNSANTGRKSKIKRCACGAETEGDS